MSTIDAKQLSRLSIFTCKVCDLRVRHPVMQVEAFGNICGICNEKSVFTNVKRNKDVEVILSKLCVSCRYVHYGCNFENTYHNVRDHEEECRFQCRVCPFVYLDECDCYKIPDIIEHIFDYHDEHVIFGDKELIDVDISCLSEERDKFYLLEIADKQFLFRVKFDVDNDSYRCALYYFADDDRSSNNVSFVFITEHDNLNVKSKRINGVSDLYLGKDFDFDEILTISSLTLKNLKCSDTINISLIYGNEETLEMNKKGLEWFVCISCDDYCVEGGYYCYFCHNKLKKCSKCFKATNKCPSCDKYFHAKITDFAPINAFFKFPCRFEHCNEMISGDVYNEHLLNCQFRLYKCIFKDCSYEGRYLRFYGHLKTAHKANIYDDEMTVVITPDDDVRTSCLVKYNNVYQIEYKFSDDGFLAYKIGIIGTKHFDNVYVWELHVRRNNSLRKVILSDVCENNDKILPKHVNISEFRMSKELSLSVYIKYKDVEK